LQAFCQVGEVNPYSGESFALDLYRRKNDVSDAVLVLEWKLNKGKGWPSLLVSPERAIGSATFYLF